MIKIICVTAVLAATSLAMVSAQHIQAFKRQLARQDLLSGGDAKVVVEENEDAKRVIEYSDTARVKPSSVNGYRVRIFFGNEQTARNEANEIAERFRSMYPTVPLYLNYESPYFKVTVGDCWTDDEAIILWGRVKQYFDRAFVIRERITLGQIKNMGIVELKVESEEGEGENVAEPNRALE